MNVIIENKATDIISEEQFRAFIACRNSGVTNMFDARTVSFITGLSRDEVLYIMQTFGELVDAYGEEE